MPLVQTWNKKQFLFDAEVCSSNENKSIWFGVPWGTITAAVTLVLSSPREWTNNYVINFFPSCCFVVSYWINVERSHLTYLLKTDLIPKKWDSLKMGSNLYPAKVHLILHNCHISGEENLVRNKAKIFPAFGMTQRKYRIVTLFSLFFSVSGG